MLNRRQFLQKGALSGSAAMAFLASCRKDMALASAKHTVDPNFDTLINKQYANALRLKQVGGQYVGYDFKLTPTPVDWVLELARYQGRISGHPVDYTGYWVFKPNEKLCWQCQNGYGALAYWDQDRKATGNPEDFEIFSFYVVDRERQTVVMQNPHGAYVQLIGDTFSCDGNKGSVAVELVPEFNPLLHLNSRFRGGNMVPQP